VITPCYNAAPHLAESIDSALSQSYGAVEVIVVDDGSTDASRAIAADFARRHPSRVTVVHTDHAGPYPARNAGLRKAGGELIAFLDADDWWSPTALEKLANALAGADADIAYSGWQNVGEGVTSAPFVPPEYRKQDLPEAFIRGCPWPIHAALVRRAIVEKLHGFSERRFSSMDFDFWLRTLTVTRQLVRVPEVLAYYRWHDAGQISAVKWRQVVDALYAQQEFIRANPHLVAHLPARRLRELTEGQVLNQARRALWKRDLSSAHRLFRHVAAARSFGARDLRHVLGALLPFPAFRWLVEYSDRIRS
jgi:glycosyltransferase involved in cell wall biosynthesis